MPRRNTPHKHTPFHAPKTCVQKRQFRSEKEALNAADYHMLQDMQLELTVYKCDQCQYWHLTKSDNQAL